MDVIKTVRTRIEETQPATAYGALVRYGIIAAGVALGVTSDSLLVELASGLGVAATAFIGLVKTRKAEA